MISFIVVCILVPFAAGVLQQVRDSNNVIGWRTGPYRNRNVIPRPIGLDLEKKHRRGIEETNEENLDVASESRKKNFIREHFSLPIGAQMPLGYNGRVQKKGKKSDISKDILQYKQSTDMQRRDFAPILEDQYIIAIRRTVPKTWGLTWQYSHTHPEMSNDAHGYERSNLAGARKHGKISEQEFDSGLMGRGLGGMVERAENENAMEEKFEEQMEDEIETEKETNYREPR